MQALALCILFATWILPIALVFLLKHPARHGVIAVATYGLTMAAVLVPAGIYFAANGGGAYLTAPTLFSGVGFLVASLGLLLAPTNIFRLLFCIAPIGIFWYCGAGFWAMGIRAVIHMDVPNRLLLGPMIFAPLSGMIFLNLESTRKHLRGNK